ncbi:hypothetical protein [Desulfovibrio piger]|uniref:hypothetical protein n=1 Tax=Desulfovibrio piger TaxID=901 RepID=UPI00243285E5|nr:hypothetical protein [Desulfovibrio piger]
MHPTYKSITMQTTTDIINDWEAFYGMDGLELTGLLSGNGQDPFGDDSTEGM